MAGRRHACGQPGEQGERVEIDGDGAAPRDAGETSALAMLVIAAAFACSRG
ncbi:MAG: hypothetical protein NDJ94_13950 [Vicinamibacteria bacterium]|nr:hypothetical protein [Vicinamibacteria bacterium]